MNLFDGLHLYEIVLLILGSVLFLVLLVILITFVIQRRSITVLLPFLIASVLMIGFPAVSKVRFDENGIEIDKAALALARNPSDEAAKRKLETLVAEAKPRAAESAEGLVKIARAEAVLGNSGKAVDTLNQALNRNPELEAAKDLKSRLKMLPSTNEPAATRRAVEANIARKPEG
jgi:hypothetical protein